MSIQTPFELSSRATFTSRADGETFLSAVVAATHAVATVEGQTVENRDIVSIRLGTGPRKLLAVGAVHGNEPAGRDMLLIKLRDLAYAEDQTTADFLAAWTVIFVPTVNADRLLVQRENADNIDINRTMYSLTTPESEVIHKLITKYRPDVLLDAHERGGVTATNDLEVFSRARIDDNCEAEVASLGLSLQDYLVAEVPRNVALYPEAWLTRVGILASAAHRQTVEILFETWHEAHTPTFRVAVQEDAWDALRVWCEANAVGLKNGLEAARKRAVRRGADRADFTLMTGSLFYDANLVKTVISPPHGYAITTPANFTKWAEAIGIVVKDGYVIMAQPSRTMLPTLLESAPASDDTATAATAQDLTNQERVIGIAPWPGPFDAEISADISLGAYSVTARAKAGVETLATSAAKNISISAL